MTIVSKKKLWFGWWPATVLDVKIKRSLCEAPWIRLFTSQRRSASKTICCLCTEAVISISRDSNPRSSGQIWHRIYWQKFCAKFEVCWISNMYILLNLPIKLLRKQQQLVWNLKLIITQSQPKNFTRRMSSITSPRIWTHQTQPTKLIFVPLERYWVIFYQKGPDEQS